MSQADLFTATGEVATEATRREEIGHLKGKAWEALLDLPYARDDEHAARIRAKVARLDRQAAEMEGGR